MPLIYTVVGLFMYSLLGMMVMIAHRQIYWKIDEGYVVLKYVYIKKQKNWIHLFSYEAHNHTVN